MSPAVPTFTTSDMRAPPIDFAMTVGPDTLLMIPRALLSGFCTPVLTA
jgi:hypothetical protein